MNCPTCPSSVLVMTDRSGVEIDYCPTCRGVWLDRGELDKIIERAAAVKAPVGWRGDDDDDDDRRRHGDARYTDHHYPKKKKKSFLGDMFDF
jgi:Zn-finger nucleic acid-binding protein